MAEKKVSELNSALSIELNDLFLLTQSLGQGEYDSLSLTASLLATWLASQVEFPLLLTYTTATTLIGAINEIAQSGGGGGGGGATVYLGTTAPTSAQGSNADLYIQYTVGTPNTVDALYVKISGAWSEIETGGGTGATDLDDLSDVALSSPSNGQVLKYNSTTGKWENANESGGGGSGVDVFVITKTGNTYDKTFAEIKAAVDAGDLIILKIGNVSYICTYMNLNSSSYVLHFMHYQGSTSSSSYMTIEETGLTLLLSSQTFSTIELDTNCVILKELSGTLLAGNTSLVIYDTNSDCGLDSNSLLDIYTDVYGVAPTSVSVNLDSQTAEYYVTLTFAARQADMEVKVRIY